MTDQELIASVQGDMTSAMKRLVTEGYRPGTIAFALAKMGITKEILAKYHCRNVEVSMTDVWVIFLNKLGFGIRWAKFLRFLQKIRYALKPHEVFLMDGRKFYFNWLDDKSRYIFEDYKAQTQTWEPETTHLVKQLVKPGDVCIDLGASIGYFTLLFGQLVGPTGRVYAFEPTMRGYKYLVKNIKLNGYQEWARAFNLGAWDTYETVGVPRCDDRPTPTKCVPVAQFLADVGQLTYANFIKIDIDGSEPWALRGLIPLIENSPNLKMVCEYYPAYIEKAGGNPQEVLDILNKYFDITVIPGDYGEGCWNYLCIRKCSV